MHTILEGYMLDKPIVNLTPEGVLAGKMAQQIVDQGLNDKLEELWASEAVVFYPDMYAGATDGVGIYEGKEAIIDFKQTNKPKQREWIDYFLQMAAYGMAHDAVYGTMIEQGVIMMCSKDGFYQQFMIEGEEFRDAKHKFLGRLDEFYSGMDNNSDAMVSGSG